MDKPTVENGLTPELTKEEKKEKRRIAANNIVEYFKRLSQFKKRDPHTGHSMRSWLRKMKKEGQHNANCTG